MMALKQAKLVGLDGPRFNNYVLELILKEVSLQSHIEMIILKATIPTPAEKLFHDQLS